MIIKIFKELISDFDFYTYYVKIPNVAGIAIVDKSAIIEYEIDYFLINVDFVNVCFFGAKNKWCESISADYFLELLG